MSLKGTEPESGSRIGPTVRVGNKQLRDIPAVDRLLEVVCPDGGSRKGGPRLVAVVKTSMALVVINTPLADQGAGRVFTPCRCRADAAEETDQARDTVRETLTLAGIDPSSDPGPAQARGHVLDVGKVLAAAERLRHRPRKGRRVDVRAVSI